VRLPGLWLDMPEGIDVEPTERYRRDGRDEPLTIARMSWTEGRGRAGGGLGAGDRTKDYNEGLRTPSRKTWPAPPSWANIVGEGSPCAALFFVLSGLMLSGLMLSGLSGSGLSGLSGPMVSGRPSWGLWWPVWAWGRE
jgi:hypothetical protein